MSNPDNVAQVGLRFFLEQRMDQNLEQTVIHQLFSTLAAIQLSAQPTDAPAEGESAEIEKKPSVTINKRLQQLHEVIKINFGEATEDLWENSNYQCYARVRNYRDAPEGHAEQRPDFVSTVVPGTPLGRERSIGHSRQSISSHNVVTTESLDLERDPIQHELLLRQVTQVPQNIDGHNLLVQHTEAAFLLRKHIIDLVQKMLPTELKDLNVNGILQVTQMRQRTMESNLQALLMKEHGFNNGRSYSNGYNISIFYRTFLEQVDTLDVATKPPRLSAQVVAETI